MANQTDLVLQCVKEVTLLDSVEEEETKWIGEATKTTTTGTVVTGTERVGEEATIQITIGMELEEEEVKVLKSTGTEVEHHRDFKTGTKK